MDKIKKHHAWLPCCLLAAGMPLWQACRVGHTEGNPSASTAHTIRPPRLDAATMASPAAVSSPVVWVYKTRGDYSRLVPVLMDEARQRIVSYPDPRDLTTNGKLAYPTPLADGYWLDNRGISPRAAFLTYTYEEYSRMDAPPPMADLMAHIVDKHPFVFIQACGRRADYKDIVGELNEMIRNGKIGMKRRD